jgi:hypothetical protein
MKQTPSTQSGFIMLFAVIIVAIIFLLGAGFLSTAQKETMLSATSTESQLALGAADAGIECALYKAFSNTGAFSCAGHLNTPGVTGPGTVSYPIDMAQLDPESTACGIVTIKTGAQRDLNNDGILEATGTEVQSRGFNVCTLGPNGILVPNSSDPLLVERKLIVWYADSLATPAPAGGGGPVLDPASDTTQTFVQ